MARISHGSEEAQTATSYDRFLRSVVLSKGDWSVVEHASLTVIFFVDRGITHEIVRHRIASYTQSSTRFINYTKKIEPSFIYPTETFPLHDEDWVKAIRQCEESYKALVGKGWTPQIARSVFPNALGSKIAMTCNLRNWRHFLLMRSTREAHPQMRQVIDPLLEEMKQSIPILFEDIEAGATQADNLKKMR
jgi:thymidylate synthase (FAD)